MVREMKTCRAQGTMALKHETSAPPCEQAIHIQQFIANDLRSRQHLSFNAIERSLEHIA